MVRVALERLRLGKASKSLLLVGPRGAGKTVLLDAMCDGAEGSGIQTLRIEAPELRQALLRLTPSEKRYLRAMAELGLGACRSTAR